MNDNNEFELQCSEEISKLGKDSALRTQSTEWLYSANKHKYSYHFKWLGRPIIQYPQDIIAMQEIIWQVKPNLIIETGIARGGSLILYASLLELLGGKGNVLGIDIDIRSHNRHEIERHPMSKRIKMFNGSSINSDIIKNVYDYARGKGPILVVLDSNHTHDHVLSELRAYAPLVTKGSYLVVFDTIVEEMPENFSPNRPWGPGNNPMSALNTYLRETDRFVRNDEIDNKLLITVAPGGYLYCVKD
jgi:cephalosporin hydroxylase